MQVGARGPNWDSDDARTHNTTRCRNNTRQGSEDSWRSAAVQTRGRRLTLVFWVATQSDLVSRYQRFQQTHCLHLQGLLFQNVYIAYQFKRCQPTSNSSRKSTARVGAGEKMQWLEGGERTEGKGRGRGNWTRCTGKFLAPVLWS